VTYEYQRPLFLLISQLRLEICCIASHLRTRPRIVEFVQQSEGEIWDGGGRLAESKLRIISEREYSGVRQFNRQKLLQPEMPIVGSPCFRGVPIESVNRNDTATYDVSDAVGERV
jgi:hypothetical protein